MRGAKGGGEEELEASAPPSYQMLTLAQKALLHHSRIKHI